ncbi:hypothetical protein HMPREF1433_00611 [Helicobacter pylori GAMchJs117Ai]|nr:hypothetical protein HMPREF1433_00611 [Helicobacter pylori GAMchJs117Ai]
MAGWISIPYQRMGVIKTPTLLDKSLLMILEYPLKRTSINLLSFQRSFALSAILVSYQAAF